MIYRTNKIRDRLSKGEAAIGAFVQTASPEIVEVVGNTGYDYVWIDGEHGAFHMETTVQMIRAAEATGVTPIVRVPDHDSSYMMHVLDAGAMGIVAPQVTSAEQARNIVAATKYRIGKRGDGTRGACPLIRAAGHQAPEWLEFARWSNDQTLVWLLVETVEGLENLDDILDVKGVDAIVLGAFDLAVSMGYDGDRHHPEVIKLLDTVIQRARKKDTEVVGFLFEPTVQGMQQAKQQYAEQGCRIFIAGSDRRILVNSFNDIYAGVSM